MPEEEPVECCVELCDTGGSGTGGDSGGDSGGDTDGSTATCSKPAPFPGTPAAFDCPVHLMPYNCGKKGCDLFDCDDYAYACKMWSDANGYNTCQFEFNWKDAKGKSNGHVINPVEFDYPPGNGVLHKWCLIEPQNNSSYGCWIQGAGDPVIPNNVFDALCTHWNAAPGTCSRGTLWCTGKLCKNAGEACFTTIPSVCEEFKNKTGICVDTWKK